MPDPTAKKATANGSDEKLPPTPPAVMAVLILILIGLMVTTYRACFYPSPPATWKTIHEKADLPMVQVNEILSKSGATVDSIKPQPEGTVEVWQLKHRTGTWTLEVRLKKTPTGVVYSSEKMSCYITNFPSYTRTWEYPTPAEGAAPAAAEKPAPAAAPAPAK